MWAFSSSRMSDSRLRDRVVGGQVVRFVQVDGFKLAGDVQAERLHEFLVGHLAIDVAGEPDWQSWAWRASLSTCRPLRPSAWLRDRPP